MIKSLKANSNHLQTSPSGVLAAILSFERLQIQLDSVGLVFFNERAKQ